MAGSIFGNIFKISTWGESHGKGIGVVIDGCPAGLELNETDIQICLNRRRPGQSPFATPRKETDAVEILSGVFEGKTTGTPISLIVFNQDQRSHDYSQIASYYRPGHADYSYDSKYGFRDYKGSGRASGRETTARVAGGAIAKKILATLGVTVTAYTYSIGPVTIDMNHFDINEISNNFLCMPDSTSVQAAETYLNRLKEEGNSSGGIIDCIVKNIPAGIGEPVFEKLDANLAKAVMSIGSVKGIEIGDGFKVAERTGIENNDAYYCEGEKTLKKTNHAGGILGGISDGSDIFIRAAIKPTPSIGMTQQTANKSFENIEINIEGRHDPIIVPRAVVVVEAMVALTVVDMVLMNMSSKMDNVIKVYNQ
ncbi:MAG: chorismate synthase [Firmicutes bacterium HGW-Firmicutes-1]|jgi:chorismate synthase|nr:MAG: chorismate synthase [Firmicutes bacterium HGW-Firmicutes-1]